jgi:hypothetical protein
MSETEFNEENLVRIENRIVEVKTRLYKLQERVQTLKDGNLDPQQTHELIAILIEHLELIDMRLEQTCGAIREGQIVGATGCTNER